MDDELLESIEESLARGETVAVATVATGAAAGKRMLIWAAGHTRGHLGWPRLNQRVALYAEQLFERGARSVEKAFDVQGERVMVHFEFRARPAIEPGRSTIESP